MIPPVLILDIGLMAMLVVVAFAIVRMRSLFAIVMLQGVYSLLSAAWFVSLDAVDVAFTEAAVGAGVSTILRTSAEIHIPNVVTAVLASYRGFDTFGEVVVIFAAGLGVLLLLGLNGNAGKWRARPNGVNVSSSMLPSAQAVCGESAESLENMRKTAKTSKAKKTVSKTKKGDAS